MFENFREVIPDAHELIDYLQCCLFPRRHVSRLKSLPHIMRTIGSPNGYDEFLNGLIVLKIIHPWVK